ncbi:hypothetical protein J7I94_02440 [Streptomyces sp. ISL-12]|uniref:hypothetical protein n=1 Tax=Streptomyces sp. ISL-12 TaxID=2819177 RepID=UPI001BE69CDF|nr:hypothetical protein [Streptomyces sp. ISL-12]MBT2409430.1 hypothetical protein [Streptomyces sp. ISL-12]
MGAGRVFGHHLGLPGALSGLPLSPLVPGYAGLAAAQHAAGARHAAEILLPSGGGLRVLDGLAVPSGPRGHRRVDGALLDRVARGAGPAAELARLLAVAHRRDPLALRRIVLYQLIGLVQDRAPDQWQQAIAESGIHAGEAAGLLAAARVRPVLDQEQRAAAESLADAWEERRLYRARMLLERLPQGDDPALRALRTELAGRLAALESALEAARRAVRRGDTEAATEQYLRALGQAADDRRALHGLIRVHRPGPGRPAPLRTELALGHVALTWPVEDDAGAGSWRLLCLLKDERGATGHREVPALAGTARDTDVVPGTTVRYAALPLRDGQVAGPPLVSHRLAVTPEVGDPAVTDGPGRVTCAWTCPPGATSVTVEHTGPQSTAERLDARPDGLTATGLAVGAHAFHVSCHYRAPDGTSVASPGRLLTRTVHPWPEPVGTLTAEPEGDALRFGWTGASGADVRLIEWPGDAPAPGTELRTDELPPRLDEPGPEPSGTARPDPGGPAPESSRTVRPRRGGHLRVAAVAVLGDRALAGPVVDVEALRPVTALAARRLPDGEAAVTLDWPEGTGQVTVAWEPLPGPETADAGAGDERTVTAHAYRRGGLRLPVGPHAVRLRASVASQIPDAVVLPAATAEVLLAADTAIGYQLVRPPGRFLSRSRRRTLLRVTLLGPDPAGADLPEFVCVVRGGTLRPRDAGDGTTVLRIAGRDLTRHGGTVEQELPDAPVPAPYTLRGFLLGEHATAVRLEEPSPTSLVVR